MKNRCTIVAMVAGWFLAAISCSGNAVAELTVASLFTDNAVLQRDRQVPVWGTADAGSAVTVKFATQKKTAVADNAGQWKVHLESMVANSAPQILSISSGKDEISCANVVVGEVWICSGQSNMEMSHTRVGAVRKLVGSARGLRSFRVGNTVAFTQQRRCEGNWVDQHPDSAVAFAFAYFLQQASDVPVGIIQSSWGSSSIEAWMPRDMTDTVPHFKTLMDEFDADIQTRQRITSILDSKPWNRRDDIFLRRQSNILYNAMMHPLAPYACRGLVWYQGERNTQSMHGMVKTPWFSRNSGMLKYGDTLKAWIQRYRQQWGNDQMEFMIVMLPGYYKPMKTGPKLGGQHPASHSWAYMRESQLSALELEHAHVANTIDLGMEKNIHPQDKLPIGQRLALLAAANTLGQDVQAYGPMFKSAEVQAGQVVVHFDHAQGLRTVDQKAPKGFWLAEDNGKWVEADSEIKGQSVVLGSSELTSPKYVRYAFVGKPDVNLVNEADLPAYPFRTDNFNPSEK